jgi:hypothetical protein
MKTLDMVETNPTGWHNGIKWVFIEKVGIEHRFNFYRITKDYTMEISGSCFDDTGDPLHTMATEMIKRLQNERDKWK